MFGISFPELLVIMVIALLVFGPEKLPEMAHSIGKLMGELKRSSDSLRREFYNSVYTPAEEIKKRIDLETRSLSPISELSDIGKEIKRDLSALNPLCPDTQRIKQEQEAKAAALTGTPSTETLPTAAGEQSTENVQTHTKDKAAE